jgi:hypothetical protein
MFLFANYAIFSVFITMEVVFLLAFVIPQSSTTAMECYVHPNAYDASALDTVRRNSRLARSNAWASIQRAIQEPSTHRTDLELAQELLGEVDTLIVSVLTLEAYLLDNPSHCALPMVNDFCNNVDEALRKIALAIREGQSLTGFPNLQEALSRLQDRKSEALLEDRCRSDLRFVISEARRVVDILNGMRGMVGMVRR